MIGHLTVRNILGIESFVNGRNQRSDAEEPSEDDLRKMIEDRERQQEVGWSESRKTFTRIVLGGIAVVAVCALVFATNRDLSHWLFYGPPADSATRKSKLDKPTDQSEAAMLMRAAGIPMPEDLKMDGELVSEDDIRFTMELMQFMRVPDGTELKHPVAPPVVTPKKN